MRHLRPASGKRSGNTTRWIRRAIYWLAVTAISLTLVWLLLQLIQSYDGATVGILAIGPG